jgi:hypothetical protein
MYSYSPPAAAASGRACSSLKVRSKEILKVSGSSGYTGIHFPRVHRFAGVWGSTRHRAEDISFPSCDQYRDITTDNAFDLTRTRLPRARPIAYAISCQRASTMGRACALQSVAACATAIASRDLAELLRMAGGALYAPKKTAATVPPLPCPRFRSWVWTNVVDRIKTTLSIPPRSRAAPTIDGTFVALYPRLSRAAGHQIKRMRSLTD